MGGRVMLPIHIPEEVRHELAEAFARQRACRLPRLPLAAAAFLAWALQKTFRRAVVLVSDSLAGQDEIHRCLAAFAGPQADQLLYYPARESSPGRAGPPEILGDRLQTLIRLLDAREPVLVATCVQALMQTVPPPEALRAQLLRLKVGEEHDPETLANRLEELGYDFLPEVQFKGQAARRGGLLDVWSPTDPHPARIEFFGATVETIRTFDEASQRSFARAAELLIPPADETRLTRPGQSAPSPWMAYLPGDVIYFWSEPPGPADGAGRPTPEPAIEERAAAYEKTRGEARDGGVPALPRPRGAAGPAPDPEIIISFRQVRDAIAGNASAWQCVSGWDIAPAGAGEWATAPLITPGFQAVARIAEPTRRLFEPDVFEARRREWLAGLEARAREGLRTYFYFSTQGALDRFRETHAGTPFHLRLGALADGFIHEGLRLAVISESSLIGFQKLMPGRYEPQARRRKERRQTAGESITDWLSIEPGDLVVHVDHGIGKYLGLNEVEFDGRRQETLAIEFAEKARLYVPTSQAHLLSRYIGVGKKQAAVHRLGGRRWLREKAAAEQAVRDLAASLLETQALRESRPGFAFPPDPPWQHEFEAAFPYQETDDQAQAVREVKQDMESARPMDRLVCGDVGYGKTEVAMRAAFKAVLAGRQVALLVPTTVLAQQHYEVFLERLRAYPVRIELLCRFRTLAEQAAVVRDLAAGKVDIVIGTHRLVQPDIRFKNLGLLIIDEEQRFGVEHKERLKGGAQMVDILTLTATPIPRTLYMSLTGARDISMIQTPPKARLPIETRVVKNDDALVREAIARELNRGGQVYYLHNRVMTIERARERLQRLAPAARIGIVHGQMPTSAMAQVMHAFAAGRLDLLLCTTIIESGVDIPNVNTIIIDRADRFGMADLYQLRGRVGRSPRKAYAVLLLPVHGHLLDTPRQRLHAILEHTDLGAGFRLAMRDLEIRGAGNLLGVEQSGHIAAVGFDLYCQLLRRTIAQMSGETGGGGALGVGLAPGRIVDVTVALDFLDLSSRAAEPDRAAFLPADYVEDERLRVGVYRKIAAASAEEEIEALREDFRDRFGPLPPPLERLLKIAVLRMLAAARRVTAVECRDGKLMLTRDGEPLMLGRQFPRLKASSADARLDEIRRWLERVTEKGLEEK